MSQERKFKTPPKSNNHFVQNARTANTVERNIKKN